MSQQQQQLRPLDEAARNELALSLFKGGVNFAKRHYLATTLYVLGLIVFNLATGFAVNEVQRREYTAIISTIDIGELEKAKKRARLSYEDYYDSKGWFFSCDAKCTRNHQIYEADVRRVEEIEASHYAVVSKARSGVGVLSEYAVSDARDLFSEAFHRGKEFAKRQSIFDALFLGLSAARRDESLLSVLLNWLLQAALNFTIGMLSALVSFGFHVGSLIISYNGSGNALSAIGFFFLAFTAACAYVASFIVGGLLLLLRFFFQVEYVSARQLTKGWAGLYVVAAGTTYLVVKTVTANGMRLEFEPGRRGIGGRILNVRQHQQQQQQWREEGSGVHEE